MPEYLDFDNFEESKQYLHNHFRQTKCLQDSRYKNTVYQGFWCSDDTKKSVIVKFVQKPEECLIFDDSLCTYVHADIFFLAYLSKFNICPQPLYYLNSKTNAYIVMEKLSDDWDLLFDYLFENRQITNYRHIIKNIIEVIKLMKENQVYYTDTKLENIMINRVTLQVKFIDFEDCIFEKNVSSCITNLISGTIGYCAPEVLLDSFYDVEKSQVFAIGCLIFFLYEKNLAFETITDTEKLERRKFLRTPQEVREIIRSCLVRKPKRRPSIDQLLNLNWIQNRPKQNVFYSYFWSKIQKLFNSKNH